MNVKYHFVTLERGLAEHVQRPVDLVEGNQILKKNLLIVRLALYQYLRFDDKGKELACYFLEVARKQIKDVMRHYSDNIASVRVLICLLKILDSLLEVAEYRDLKKSTGDFRHITLGNINITLKNEKLKERYQNRLIFSAFTISHFLALEWPTEMKERGEKIIDTFLLAKKAMLEKGIQESLTYYQALGEEGEKGVIL